MKRRDLLGAIAAGAWAGPLRAQPARQRSESSETTEATGATKAAEFADESAWRALAAPGHSLILRHAATVPGIGDPPGFRLDDCATQRNLSAAGRAQAQRLGAAVRARGLRVDALRSSRWCRCLDTARLAFPELPLQPLDALNSFFEDRSTAAAQTAALRSWLADLGARRAVLVTHMVNIAALTGEGVAMGEALVIANAPAGETTRVLARLRVG